MELRKLSATRSTVLTLCQNGASKVPLELILEVNLVNFLLLNLEIAMREPVERDYKFDTRQCNKRSSSLLQASSPSERCGAGSGGQRTNGVG